MFYIEQNSQIVLFDEDKKKLERTVEKFMPQYKGLEIKTTSRPIIDYKFADTPEYQEEQAQKEAARIAMLNLTAADVERAIYKAKGIDFDDIIAFLEAQPLAEDGTPQVDIKALKIELKANNFYRGSEWVATVGAMLGFTSKQLDLFFETNDYTKLLTQVVTEPESDTETTTEDGAEPDSSTDEEVTE